MAKKLKKNNQNQPLNEKKIFKDFLEIISSRMVLLSIYKAPSLKNDFLVDLIFDNIYENLNIELTKENTLSSDEITYAVNTKEDLCNLFKEFSRISSVINYNELHKCDKDISTLVNNILSSPSFSKFNLIKISVLFHGFYSQILKLRSDMINFSSKSTLNLRLNEINENINTYQSALDMAAYMLHILGLKIYIRMSKVENKFLGKVRINKDESVSILFLNKPVITPLDFIKYKKSKDKSDLFNTFIDRFTEECTNEYLGILNTIAESYKKFKYWDKVEPSVLVVDRNVEFPFVNVVFNKNKARVSAIDIFTKFDNKTLVKPQDSKKFAFPSDGCILKFNKSNSQIKKAIITESNDDYIFDIEFTQNSYKDSNGKYVNNSKFFLNKDNVENIYCFLKDNKDDNDIVTLLSNFLDYRSQPIKAYDVVYHRGFNIATIVFMLSCLYVIYLEPECDTVTIENLVKDEKEDKNLVYRTALLRKLPKGHSASVKALTAALKNKVNIPRGFTYSKEHVISNQI